jgi:hypothetical protein
VSWLKEQGSHFEPASGAVATIMDVWRHLHATIKVGGDQRTRVTHIPHPPKWSATPWSIGL